MKDKIIILGDSQLHRIDGERLSGRNMNTKRNKGGVRSKGRLNIENVFDNFKDILHEESKEIILHVGVNNIEKEEEDEILRKYEELGKSINCSLTISGILCRRAKPMLNKKIERLNGKLKNLCSKNGYDFIDNSNVVFRHIGHDGLHISRDGERRLALNFINHLRGHSEVKKLRNLGISHPQTGKSLVLKREW